MLQAISNPNLDKDYQEKITNLKRIYTEDKKAFETKYQYGLIDLDNLMSEVGELNKNLKNSIDSCERELSTFWQIQTSLKDSLENFDRFSIYGFNGGAPLISKDGYKVQVLSKGYVTEIDSSKDYASYEFLYEPKYKDVETQTCLW